MRILMRAQIRHDKAFSPDEVIIENLMGGNIGNWLYQYSLYRALMIDENTQIDIFNPTKQKVTDAFIASVNEKYDLFVLPLANAFKLSFIDEMRALTKLLKGLKIPCIVPGIGIQSKLNVDFHKRFEYKDDAKAFVSAVLEKSSIMGVRGEATAEFLKNLGFREEEDYTVIGCPSLYTFGAHLPQVKPLDYSENSKLLFSSKVEHENKKVVEILTNLTAQHSNYFYVPQRVSDMRVSFYGADHRLSMSEQAPPRFYDREKSLCFTSPYRWINYISQNVDFSIGTRLHGNVASVLAGVPSFIMATDQRVTELAAYHNIACLPIDKVSPDIKLRDIIENTDFTRVHVGHEERFNHFVDFLEKNNISNVYSGNRNVERVYFDSVIEKLDFSDNVAAFDAVDAEEKLRRIQYIAEDLTERYTDVQKKLKKERDDFKAEKEKLIKELSKPSVKSIIKGLLK